MPDATPRDAMPRSTRSVTAPAPAPGPALPDRAADAAAGLQPTSYEEAVAELDRLVTRIEGGRLPLEESLASFQRGVSLVAYCRAQLARVEQRVSVLEADLLKPFDAGRDGEAADGTDDSPDPSPDPSTDRSPPARSAALPRQETR